MIEIIKAGFQTSIQDLGRKGYRHLGICYSGALHSRLLKTANALVGNDENTPIIEFSTGALELCFSIDCVIAICGSAIEAHITENPTTRNSININQAVYIHAGQHLVITPTNSGIRNYLAVAGGILSETVFESASTDITLELGGLNGQLIKTSDILKIANPPKIDRLCSLVEHKFNAKLDIPNYKIRAIPGPEYTLFSKQSRNDFWSSKWQISQQSNRIGCWLLSPNTKLADDKNSQNNKAHISKGKLLSHGILPGTVQVPAMGNPVVLLADAQTTGGYPRIATVISADLWQFTQIPVHAYIQFIPCDKDEAVNALRQQHFEYSRFKIALDAKLSLEIK